jgi:hypothetical protein
MAPLEMGPLDAQEVTMTAIDPDTLWCRGGFPDSVLAPDDQTSFE